MTAASASDASTPLERRLRAAASVLRPGLPDPSVDLALLDAGSLLDLLVRHVQADPRPDHMWLVCAAVATVLPTDADVTRALRALELRDADDAAIWLLDDWTERAHDLGRPDGDIEVVEDAVLVDVDFTASHDLNTGVQRVVRSLMPHWHRDRPIRPVVWSEHYACYRTLTDREQDRALDWHRWHVTRDDSGVDPQDPLTSTHLVVPWHSTVVLAEVPPRGASGRLAALAQQSGSTVVGIGYDCIPVVNAQLLPRDEPDRFADYLRVVKHMRAVAAISVSAAAEFDGFTHMLTTQGLRGPHVVECMLPSAAPESAPSAPTSGEPLVISVGSYEPRKNQMALLYAAETLWREGLRFRLTFVGGGGWGSEFPDRVRQLTRAGRPITVARAISDDELNALYAEARFSVFTSVHEGYGLPVAESLAHATPVITTEYGSTAEIGVEGGALLVDPRNDAALVEAMRELLTDDALLTKLHDAIATRPARDWQAYADELWAALITAPSPSGVPA